MDCTIGAPAATVEAKAVAPAFVIAILEPAPVQIPPLVTQVVESTVATTIGLRAPPALGTEFSYAAGARS